MQTTLRRIAVVTGAAGGMGRAIVARLIADDCHVVGVDIDAAALAGMAELDQFSGEVVEKFCDFFDCAVADLLYLER